MNFSNGTDSFYVSLLCGLLMIVFFLVWAFSLLRYLQGRKGNTNLQKMYGTGAEKKEDAGRKQTKLRLILSGVLLLAMAVCYYFLI